MYDKKPETENQVDAACKIMRHENIHSAFLLEDKFVSQNKLLDILDIFHAVVKRPGHIIS